ncbi:nacht and ankyrin domain protein [Colletotrichum truncatum]|uniref:Nacht and ankyrin domain protein n=1 Tax=Colletotrichum truncatum TaxID=5467 RepID=A0ACC3Z1Y9_COLTU
MSSHARALRREDFQIAVICAVGCEYDAVALAFDEIREGNGGLGNASGDNNKYKIGRIGGHDVVLLLLPNMGKVNAASAATALLFSYPGVKLAILTGICGGVPRVGTDNEVLLGDVVISKSVVQYDFGRRHPDRFALKDTVEERLGRPNVDIRTLIATVQTLHGRNNLQRRTNEILEWIQQKATDSGYQDLYKRPAVTEDRLFEPDYLHKHYTSTCCGCNESRACEEALQASCEELQCDFARLMLRKRLKKPKLPDEGHELEASVAQDLQMFVGRVGSGDTVMKSGLDRDRIAEDHDLIAFEMEGAGVWDQIPCIIVKAICDYADSHKNKKWQAFAAATAASAMKALLEDYPHTDVPIPPTTQSVIPILVENQVPTRVSKPQDENERKLLQLLAANHDAYKNFNPRRVTGTCEWFFKDHRFHRWLDSTASSIIWVSAGPGCGKSVLSRALVDKIQESSDPATTTVCYFFFKDGEERRTNSHDALSALLHQLFAHSRTCSLISHAVKSYTDYGESLRNNFYQLWTIFTACVERPNAGEVICVLDALDECSQNDRKEILKALETFYFSHQLHQSTARLKFLITSRPYDDLDSSFMKFRKSLSAETYIQFDGDEQSEEIHHEIDLVIDHKVNELSEDFDVAECQQISARLKAMENRTYLWLSLTFDIITQHRSAYSRVSDIEYLLSDVPSGVFNAYEKILSRSYNKIQASHLLQIILVARRPLTLDEVNYALTLQEKEFNNYDSLRSRLWRRETFKRTVKNLCGLFISVYDDKVSLIHQTAREFLTCPEQQNEWQGSVDIFLAHNTIFISCIRFLSLQDLNLIWQNQASDQVLSFVSYAATNWTIHYNSQDEVKRNTFRGDARDLCHISKKHTPVWVEVLKKEPYFPWRYSSKWTDLTLASYFGLLEVAKRILDQEMTDVNSKGGFFGTAVKAAAAQGHDKLVQMLVQHGADCDTGGAHFETALHDDIEAARWCRRDGEDLMALLLESLRDETELTPELVISLGGESWRKERTIDILFKKYLGKVEIMQEFVVAAAGSKGNVMSVILENHGDRIEITEEVVKALSGNRDIGKQMMASLFEKRGHDFKITEQVVIAAVSNTVNGDVILAMLLEKRGDDFEITEQVVIAAASNPVNGDVTLAMMLEKRGNEINITQKVIMAAAKTGSDEIAITQEVLIAIATSPHGEQLMALLLEVRPNEVRITQEVLIAIARSPRGEQLMALLLEVLPDEVQITQEVLIAIAEGWAGEEMMALLLEMRGDEVHITQEVLMVIAENRYGVEMMALILEARGDEIQITRQLLKAVEECGWQASPARHVG